MAQRQLLALIVGGAQGRAPTTWLCNCSWSSLAPSLGSLLCVQGKEAAAGRAGAGGRPEMPGRGGVRAGALGLERWRKGRSLGRQ